MSDHPGSSGPLAIRSYFGVWPYRPALVGIIGFVVMWGSISYRDPIFSAGVPGYRIFTSIAVSAVTAVVMASILVAARRISGKRSPRYLVYLAICGLCAFAGNAARILMGQTPGGGENSLGASLVTGTIRLTALVLVIQAIAGIASWRLWQQIERTEVALQESREQQRMMLQADEAVRRQVAEVLHDGVQAGLVAACLELRMASEKSQPEAKGPIDSVIGRLESMRALDVRGAARALSPSLESQDLDHCLAELGGRYAPGMKVTIDVDPILQTQLLQDDSPALLACYRIVEQALLNAAMHGHARRCTVTIDGSPSVQVNIRVQDDGLGMNEVQQQAGLGSAIVTTWTRLFDGEWNLGSSAEGGCVLTARLAPSVRT